MGKFKYIVNFVANAWATFEAWSKHGLNAWSNSNANALSNANASSALSMQMHCQMRMHRQHYQMGMQLQFQMRMYDQLTTSEILAANPAVISLASLVCGFETQLKCAW